VAEDDPESLSDAFWSVARRLRHRSRDNLAQWDISPSHSRALAVLTRHGAMRLRDLSEHLHIAARSTTEVVDALEARGLLRRQADPRDRRATVVVLTEQGARVGAAIRSARDTEAAGFFGALDAADRTDLARILGKLHD
jgi:DNA-binding MarR family transcriptional regulator